MSKDSFKMFINGINVINSEHFQGSLITLSLEHTDDFIYSQEFIKECLCNNDLFLKEDFPGGFKAHISLFLIKGGFVPKEESDLLARYLETAISNIRKEIIGEKFSVYNENREKIFEKNIIN